MDTRQFSFATISSWANAEFISFLFNFHSSFITLFGTNPCQHLFCPLYALQRTAEPCSQYIRQQAHSHIRTCFLDAYSFYITTACRLGQKESGPSQANPRIFILSLKISFFPSISSLKYVFYMSIARPAFSCIIESLCGIAKTVKKGWIGCSGGYAVMPSFHKNAPSLSCSSLDDIVSSLLRRSRKINRSFQKRN